MAEVFDDDPADGTPGAFAGWDPLGLWDQFVSAVPPIGPITGPSAGAFGAFLGPHLILGKVDTLVRSRLLGRRFTVRLNNTEVNLQLEDFVVPLDAVALSTGQFEDVDVTTTGVRWEGYEFAEVRATVRNLHVRAGTPATLVAAPIDVVVTLNQIEVSRLIAARRPGLVTSISPTGVISLSWARQPGWGHVEVEAGADGKRIWVRPRALVIRGRRWSGVRRVPPLSFTLPVRSDKFHLVSLESKAGSVEVHLRLDEWRMLLSTKAQQEFLERIATAVSVLDLSGWRFP